MTEAGWVRCVSAVETMRAFQLPQRAGRATTITPHVISVMATAGFIDGLIPDFPARVMGRPATDGIMRRRCKRCGRIWGGETDGD